MEPGKCLINLFTNLFSPVNPNDLCDRFDLFCAPSEYDLCSHHVRCNGVWDRRVELMESHL